MHAGSFIGGALALWALCIAFPNLAVIPAGAILKYGPKLWEKIRRRSPKE